MCYYYVLLSGMLCASCLCSWVPTELRAIFMNIVCPSSVDLQKQHVNPRPTVWSLSLNQCHRRSCWRLLGNEIIQHWPEPGKGDRGRHPGVLLGCRVQSTYWIMFTEGTESRCSLGCMDTKSGEIPTILHS